MARELSIRITAENTDATRKLAATEQAIQGVTSQTNTMSERWAASERAAQQAVESANKKWADSPMNKDSGPIAETTKKITGMDEAVTKTADVSLKALGTEVRQLGSGLTRFGGLVTAATAPLLAFTGLSIAEMVQSSEDLKGKWATIKDQAAEIGHIFGDSLRPAIEGVVSLVAQMLPTIKGLVEWFAQWPEPMRISVAVLIALAGAVGPVLIGLGTLVGTIGSLIPLLPTLGAAFALLTGPIGLVLAAVTGLALAWATWGDDVTRIVGETYAAVKEWLWDKLEPVLTPIGGLLESLGKLWVAFRDLVGAVAIKIVEYIQALYRDVKLWLLDKFEPVIKPVRSYIEGIGTLWKLTKDVISAVVQALYTTVKTWLLDRFTAIVDGIKGKIDAVTGFFRDLYDKVVGNSYVPDLIREVGVWFSRLDEVMVRPSSAATSAVVGHFKGLSSDVSRELGNIIGLFVGPGGFKQKAINFASDFARGFVSTALDIMVPGLGQLVNVAWPIIEMGLAKIWDGLQAFWGKVKGIFNFFGSGTGEQTPVGDFNPNDPNNPFYGREDPGNPNPTPSLPEGGTSGDLYVPSVGLTPYEEYLNQRKIVYGFAGGTGGKYLDFGAGTPVILHGKERVMTEGEGEGGVTVNVYVNTPVTGGDEMRQIVYERIVPILKDAWANNIKGSRTQARQALGVA